MWFILKHFPQTVSWKVLCQNSFISLLGTSEENTMKNGRRKGSCRTLIISIIYVIIDGWIYDCCNI